VRHAAKKLKDDFMENDASRPEGMDFVELQDRFGFENARAILRTLEQFEGIPELRVTNLSYEDRMRNVMSAMKDNIRYQTRH
jgi:hypothetical protein